MRRLLALALALALASAAAALDLGAERPTRPDVTHPQNVPSDDRIRQGGDTILDAFEVTLPFLDDGTTAGYTDDYDEACPYDGSTSPDVVYTFTPEGAMGVTVDLFGSAYDTKVYIYDEDAALVACNDDFYSDWTSKLENVAVESGVQYFVIVDGYGGDAGEYQIGIEEHEPCELWWPEYVELEGEPPLVDGYVDEYNGGCYAGGSVPFQAITHWAFRGVSGWYVFEDGVSRRDTDWFEIQIPPGGHVSIAGDAEQPTFMFELGPQDCANVDVLQSVSIGPCSEGTMDILGYPGDIVWFWVGPQTHEAPDGFEGNEYAYRLFLTPPYVAVEDHSLTEVKALFR